MIVQKQTFELPSFTTLGGAVIRQVRVGWVSRHAQPSQGQRRPRPPLLRALKDQLAAMGKRVAYTEAITTERGHLDGIACISKAGDVLARSLATNPT